MLIRPHPSLQPAILLFKVGNCGLVLTAWSCYCLVLVDVWFGNICQTKMSLGLLCYTGFGSLRPERGFELNRQQLEILLGTGCQMRETGLIWGVRAVL